MDDPGTHRSPLPASVWLVGVVVVVGFALALFGRGAGPEPEPDPPSLAEPAPPPDPEPDPQPEPPGPVVGDYELLRVTELSVHGRRVFGSSMPQDAPIEPDHGAAEAFAAGMAAWLDAHLTNLQDGGAGMVADSGLDGPHELLTLTSPGRPVEHAQYEMVVWARELPEWGRTAVAVTLTDGAVMRANLVFLPGEPPTLLAAEGTGPLAPPVAGDATADDEEADT